jgi:arginine deiminase
MHLDTVFTQLDQNRFTVHPSILDLVRIFEITGRGRRELTVREMDDSLETVLEAHLHTGPVSLIRCGGHNYIASEREQWNDGSNTLCIAPGRVVVYDRNYVTNEILAGAGIDVLTIPSAELSRGRGGPRCMSMPLLRDPV